MPGINPLLTILILLLSIPLTSQSLSEERAAAEIFKSLIEHSKTITPGVRTFDLRYEGVKGTPFIFDSWKEGHIKLADKVLVSEGAKYQLNGYTADLHALLPNGKEVILPNERISELVINENGQSSYFCFEGKEIGDKRKPYIWLQQLSTGKHALYKYSYRTFEEADYKGGYSTDKRFDEFIDREKFFINQSGSWIEVRMKRKSLLNLFPDHEQFIRETIPGSKVEEDQLLQIIENLNNES